MNETTLTMLEYMCVYMCVRVFLSSVFNLNGTQFSLLPSELL